MVKFEIVKDKFRKHLNVEIIEPKRSTQFSAGYDFFSPIDIIIQPQQSFFLWTDIKIKLENNQFLQIVPRSSIGIKKKLMFMNTIGIIDCDYFENETNDGNICFAFYNYGDKFVEIKKDEKIGQGIITNYNIIDEDDSNNIRTGGIGSTN